MDGLEELTLELTDWCPLECLHCSSTSNPNCKTHLSKELSLRLVEEAAHLGAKKISLGGGEPMGSASFLTVLRHVVELKMCAEVFTCGLVGGGQNLQGLPNEVIRGCQGLDGVNFIFSFHGASRNVHDYITKTPGSFELLLNCLRECLSSGIDCEINFVPMRVNVHEFGKLVELAEGLGIQRISILRFVPQGRGLQNRQELELSGDEEDSFVESLLRLRSERHIDIRTGSPFNGIVPGNEVACRAGTGKLVVQANGNVLPCEVFKHHERCRWNLSVHTQTLTEILSTPQITVLRNILGESNCLVCPVHGALRARLEPGVRYEQISRAAI